MWDKGIVHFLLAHQQVTLAVCITSNICYSWSNVKVVDKKLSHFINVWNNVKKSRTLCSVYWAPSCDLNFILTLWFLPKLAYLNMLIILNMACTGSAGHFMNKWHAQMSQRRWNQFCQVETKPIWWRMTNWMGCSHFYDNISDTGGMRWVSCPPQKHLPNITGTITLLQLIFACNNTLQRTPKDGERITDNKLHDPQALIQILIISHALNTNIQCKAPNKKV